MKSIWIAAALAAVLAPAAAAQPPAAGEVVVYKNPSCGCCGKWAEHLRANGFAVREQPVMDLDAVKRRYGVPPQFASCHTAVVDGYVIEGHVPAADVKRLLAERPPLAGVAVPGMPPGSPGMESPQPVSYRSIGFDRNGRAQVFQEHAP